MADIPPIRVTLADLIDQYWVGRKALDEARARIASSEERIRRAIEAAGRRPVMHDGILWGIGQDGKLQVELHGDWSDRPNARDVEVPVECLRGQAEVAGDEAIRSTT